MCGRYALAFIRGFRTRFEVIDVQAQLEPRFNIAPTEEAPVIVRDGGNKALMMRWGLIPSWAKDVKIGNRLINARCESLTSRPAFRAAVKRRRCLVPATGFYEWRKEASGKIPFYIHLKDNSMFAFAGLHERWISEEGETVRSFTIVTSPPNSLAATLHNRMPAILDSEGEDMWLKEGQLSDTELERILMPVAGSRMEMHEVSTGINKAGNDSPELIEPVLRAHPLQ